jgi:hypothetical protein
MLACGTRGGQRAGRAGRAPGRCRAGEAVAWRHSRTGRLSRSPAKPGGALSGGAGPAALVRARLADAAGLVQGVEQGGGLGPQGRVAAIQPGSASGRRAGLSARVRQAGGKRWRTRQRATTGVTGAPVPVPGPDSATPPPAGPNLGRCLPGSLAATRPGTGPPWQAVAPGTKPRRRGLQTNWGPAPGPGRGSRVVPLAGGPAQLPATRAPVGARPIRAFGRPSRRSTRRTRGTPRRPASATTDR